MSPAKKPPSPRLPCTGHQREREGGSSEDHVAADGGERQKWRDHGAALHATRRNGHE